MVRCRPQILACLHLPLAQHHGARPAAREGPSSGRSSPTVYSSRRASSLVSSRRSSVLGPCPAPILVGNDLAHAVRKLSGRGTRDSATNLAVAGAADHGNGESLAAN